MLNKNYNYIINLIKTKLNKRNYYNIINSFKKKI